MDPEAFAKAARDAADLALGDWYDPSHAFRHIRITTGAFSEATERAIAGFLQHREGQAE